MISNYDYNYVMISNGRSGDGPLALQPEWGVDSGQRDGGLKYDDGDDDDDDDDDDDNDDDNNDDDDYIQ